MFETDNHKVKHFPKSFVWAIVGFLFFTIACYPGFMSADSFVQYKQAHTLMFEDGNPPVMAWLWSKLNKIWDGPQSLFLLHLAVLWSGLYIWRRNAGENVSAGWFILLGFLPWVANFEGVLWKDVGLAFSLLLALGLLSKERLTWAVTVTVVLLLMYAFMVRTNAPAALAPVVWYATGRFFPRFSNRITFALSVFFLALMFVFSYLFTYQILDAKRGHIESFMMLDDLVHLSVATDKNLFPRIDFETVKECSEEKIGHTKLIGRWFCLSKKPAFRDAALSYAEIKEAWVDAVLENPYECLKFRFDAYLYFLRNPFEKPYIYKFLVIAENDMGLSRKKNIATRFLDKYVKLARSAAPFLFKPYWWLIVGASFLCATLAMRGDQDSLKLIRVLLASALLYMLGYFPLAVMADFRYVYWSTIAISLAAITYATSDLKIVFDSRYLRTKFRRI